MRSRFSRGSDLRRHGNRPANEGKKAHGCAERVRSDQAFGGGVSNAEEVPVSRFVGIATGFVTAAASDQAAVARTGETEKHP